MKRTLLRSIYLVTVSTAAFACGPPPKPKPPVSTPEPEPEPPPPPPKCEVLEENCIAKADTMARVAGANYIFTPPEGWVYAQMEAVTLTQKDGAGAVLVLTSFEPEAARYKLARQRKAKIDELVEQAGLRRRSRFLRLLRPQEIEVADLKLQLWDGYNSQGLKGSKRGELGGELLVLSASLDTGEASEAGRRDLFGIGFAASDDADGTAAINKALQSLHRAAADESNADEAKEGDEKPEGDEGETP